MAASILLIPGGCSSLKVTETWHKPAVEGHRYQKIMILGINRDENRRKILENVIVDELRRNQVVAIPGHSLIPDMEKATHESIVAAIRASGCDAVLTIRPQSVGNNTVTQDGYAGSIYGAGTRSSYGFLKATLQISLYNTTTEELVWSSTVKTFDADREVRVSRDLGRYLFESLRRDGLI
jgi:hypothetical protein